MTLIQPTLTDEYTFGEGSYITARQQADAATRRLSASIVALGQFAWEDSRTALGARIGAAPGGSQRLTVGAAGFTDENFVVNTPGPGYAATYAALRIGIYAYDASGAVAGRFFGADTVVFDARNYFTGFQIRYGEQHLYNPAAQIQVTPNSIYEIWVISQQKVQSYGLSISAVSNFTFDFGLIFYEFSAPPV
jgi:hypothetical protein